MKIKSQFHMGQRVVVKETCKLGRVRHIGIGEDGKVFYIVGFVNADWLERKREDELRSIADDAETNRSG